MSLPRSSWFVLWLCVLTLATLLAQRRIGVPVVPAGWVPTAITIESGQTLVQTFTVRAGMFDGLRLSVQSARGAGVVTASIERGGHDDTSARPKPSRLVTAPLEALRPGEPWLLAFEPFPDRGDAAYTLTLSLAARSSPGSLTLEAAEGHTYRDGRLWWQGIEDPRDLVLSASARLDTVPAALLHRAGGWQGGRALGVLLLAAYVLSLGVALAALNGPDPAREETSLPPR